MLSGEVKSSDDFERVLGLPRKPAMTPEGLEALIDGLSSGLRYPHSTARLFPAQALALEEASEAKGLLGFIEAGGGKTLLSALLPVAVEAKRPLLLIPASLREKTEDEFREYGRHWKISRAIRIESYSIIGHKAHFDLLNNYKPDCIIADEAHKLKDFETTVTTRVARYMKENPRTIFCGFSGTFTNREIQEFYHIAAWALKEGSPLPLHHSVTEAWAGAVNDMKKLRFRSKPGVLVRFCSEEQQRKINGNCDPEERLEYVRDGLCSRMHSTLGVVAANAPIPDVALSVSLLPRAKTTPTIDAALRTLEKDWTTPAGWQLEDPMAVARVRRELVMGFFYRWDPEPPKWWLQPRKDWNAFVRSVIKSRRKVNGRHLDSASQVADAYREMSQEYADWAEVRDRYEPNSLPVWIDDDFVPSLVGDWVAQEREGIVWVEHVAVGQLLSRKLQLPYYREKGLNARGESIEKARGNIIASISANATGRNLQHYNRSLIVSLLPSGQTNEQLIARTYRPGQTRDVSVDILNTHPVHVDALEQARRDATFIQQTTGQRQKLLLASSARK